MNGKLPEKTVSSRRFSKFHKIPKLFAIARVSFPKIKKSPRNVELNSRGAKHDIFTDVLKWSQLKRLILLTNF